MKFAVDKFVIQDYATALVNYTFLSGPIKTLEVWLTPEQIRSIANEMVDFWGYFLEKMGYSVSKFEKIVPWGVYGDWWHMYDASIPKMEFRKDCSEKVIYPNVTYAQKKEIQQIAVALINYVFSTRTIETIHVYETTKSWTSYIDEMNKYMLDRLGFFLEQLFYNVEIANTILDKYSDKEDKFSMYDITRPEAEMQAIEKINSLCMT